MTEPKFTPGPWSIGTPPPNGEQTIGTVVGLMVAVATTGVGMAEETKANAHLIASAPELYEALHRLVYSPYREGTPSHKKLEDDGKAALAKARGESNE